MRLRQALDDLATVREELAEARKERDEARKEAKRCQATDDGAWCELERDHDGYHNDCGYIWTQERDHLRQAAAERDAARAEAAKERARAEDLAKLLKIAQDTADDLNADASLMLGLQHEREAALRSALEEAEGALEAVAGDDDPDDGCAHAATAKVALAHISRVLQPGKEGA